MPLCLGILTAVFLGVAIPFSWLMLAFGLVFVIHLLTNKYRFLVPYFPYWVLVLMWMTGLVMTNEAQKKTQLADGIPQNSFVWVKLTQPPKITEKTVKSEAQILSFKSDSQWVANSAKCLVVWEKDSLSQGLQQGDEVLFKASLKDIPKQNNPYAFDYRKYLAFRGISHQVYLPQGSWKILDNKQEMSLLTSVARWRMRLLGLYEEYGISGQELSVLSALTLGYKHDLDPEIQHAYAASGAIHVLAVSGLHVGIVFVIISYFLSFLKRNKLQRGIRLILVLIFIWLFALLTGASPSVLRASIMFSFIAIGQYIQRQNTIYNAIFASAFLLLVLQPFLLFNMSFQLSYSAVLSIVYFQPKIYQFITVRYRLLDKIWALTSVSLAAQIGTFPITVYYFHQFPNYFLLSNFIVIPVASIAIWLSLAFFVFSFVTPLGKLLAFVLEYLIRSQNDLIQGLEHFPYALTNDLYIDGYQLILLLLLIGLMVLFLETKAFRYAFSFLLIFVGLGLYGFYLEWQHQHQKMLVVYDVRKSTAISLIDGQEHYFISKLSVDEQQKEYTTKPHWLALGLQAEKQVGIAHLEQDFFSSKTWEYRKPKWFCKKLFFQFCQERILFLNLPEQLEQIAGEKMKLDLLIIGNRIRTNLEEILSYFDVNEIVIDSSHAQRNIEYWQNQQKISDRNIHIVKLDGAYVKHLKQH